MTKKNRGKEHKKKETKKKGLSILKLVLNEEEEEEKTLLVYFGVGTSFSDEEKSEFQNHQDTVSGKLCNCF